MFSSPLHDHKCIMFYAALEERKKILQRTVDKNNSRKENAQTIEFYIGKKYLKLRFYWKNQFVRPPQRTIRKVMRGRGE